MGPRHSLTLPLAARAGPSLSPKWERVGSFRIRVPPRPTSHCEPVRTALGGAATHKDFFMSAIPAQKDPATAMRSNYLFTSESVSEGHPDKVADQISDAVVDLFIGRDPEAR